MYRLKCYDPFRCLRVFSLRYWHIDTDQRIALINCFRCWHPMVKVIPSRTRSIRCLLCDILISYQRCWSHEQSLRSFRVRGGLLLLCLVGNRCASLARCRDWIPSRACGNASFLRNERWSNLFTTTPFGWHLRFCWYFVG